MRPVQVDHLCRPRAGTAPDRSRRGPRQRDLRHARDRARRARARRRHAAAAAPAGVTLVPVTNPLAYASERRAGDRNLNRKLAPTDDAARVRGPRRQLALPAARRPRGAARPAFVHAPPACRSSSSARADNDGPLEPFAQAAREEALAARLGVGRAVDGWLSTYAAGIAAAARARGALSRCDARPRPALRHRHDRVHALGRRLRA